NVYAKLPGADTFVILGPNNQGMGSLIAVSVDTWVTPLGEVEVDKAFVDALPKRIIDVDETAHKYEHSIEVQLPFLQFRFDKNFLFVPVCMSLNDEDTTREIGEDLANTIAKFDKKVVVIASSDFTHYEPDRIAREKDEYVIEAIKELDVAKFYNRVYERNSTACGVGPIAAMMQAAKKLGAREGKLIKYATSGDVIGDTSSVVGYGGIIIF
nr:AmmeMemoRadiSam system protein B [Methanomicrobia archaeon]